MINFSGLSLAGRREELIGARQAAKAGFNALEDKSTDYAEHHQHLVNVYSEMINTLDHAITDAKSIGLGV